MNIYAIIETGGKQYKVTTGQIIEVERLKVTDGDTVELNRVLSIGEGDNLTIGRPVIEGAKVIATSQGEHKGKKTVALKFISKAHHDKKTGHRQSYTRLVIDRIIGPGAEQPGEPVKKTRTRRTKKEVTTDGT